MARKRLLTAAVGIALAVLVWLSLAPIARARVVRVLTRHGVEVTVGRAWVGWFTVHLSDVAVRSRGSDWLRITLPTVRVDLGVLLAVRGVDASRGQITLSGSPDEIATRLSEMLSSGGRPSGDAALELAARDMSIRWSGLADKAAVLEIDRAFARRTRTGDGEVGADALRWSHGGVRIAAHGLGGRFARSERGLTWQELRAGTTEVSVALDALDGAPAEPPVDATAPRGLRTRDRLVQLAAWAAEHVAVDARVEVSGLELVVSQGTEKLNLGPGSLRIAPGKRKTEVDLVPGVAGQGSSPLRLQAAVPSEPDEIDVRVEGGPVTLASLGVRENDFGLVDVLTATLAARATITLSANAQELSFGGDGRFSSLSIAQPKLAPDPVRGIELSYRATGALQLDGSRVRVDDGEIDLGAIRLTLVGVVDRGPDFVRLDGGIGVPLSDCQHMFASIPSALVPKLAGLEMAGSFSLKSSIKLDTRKPEDIALDWDMTNHCRIVRVPADIRADRFKGPFSHAVVDEKNQRVQIASGPGTANWVPLTAISPYLEAAVTTTEDGGFRYHGGFDKGAIKSSIRDNLRVGRFLRGASTISMQVAKNLYLERDKSLSRKLQEAILTLYLEQEMTKNELLELYLNIVELGPMVYGVGPAAQYYFNTTPYDLSLGQALFLSSILPAPRRRYFDADGQLTKGWSTYLHKVMQIMRNRNKITDQELADGLAEVITLHVARSPRTQGEAPAIDWDGNVPWLAPEMGP